MPLLDDPAVSEVLVNGPSDVYFEKAGRLHRSELKFPDDASLLAAARNIAEFVNRRIDADHHSMDARLPHGSRVHMVVAPSSRQDVCISIRKLQKSLFSLEAMVERGSLSAEAAEFLQMVVMLHKKVDAFRARRLAHHRAAQASASAASHGRAARRSLEVMGDRTRRADLTAPDYPVRLSQEYKLES